MKGLRLTCRLRYKIFSSDQIDLIYEGIETFLGRFELIGQDKDQIDLIYEGIETLGCGWT